MALRTMMGASALAIAAAGAQAQELTIWHDLGENGIKWFDAVAEEFRKAHPDVTVESVSFPTDQWYGKAIAALNTDTAPDLLFNNYERVIRVVDQTGKVMDLSEVYAGMEDTGFLSEGDEKVATYQGEMIILPVQRVQMAFGARKSWLDAIGADLPTTWEETRAVAQQFTEGDPDGNGEADTYGFALQAANPRDLIHMLDLFTFGAGLDHTLIDAEGEIVIDQPKNKEVLVEFLRTFVDYGYVSPDTVTHSFPEMYQVIEGGRAGMFRVGDWNVNKWDQEDVLSGDFVIGEWPAHFEDEENAVVIGGMRGVAVPENAPNKDLAIEFAQFLLSKEAQAASLENVGAAVRGDFEMGEMSERRLYFAQPEHDLNAYDFPESNHAFYPELEASFHRQLLAGIVDPPEDWGTFVDELAANMRAERDELMAN